MLVFSSHLLNCLKLGVGGRIRALMARHRFGIVVIAIVLMVARPEAQRSTPPQPPGETIAPEIAGVVAGGTRVQRVMSYDPAWGGEGSIGAPDGSLLFSQQDLGKILKIDDRGTISTYLENSGRHTGLAYDSKGRLIGCGSAPAGVMVLAPVRSMLADTVDGQPLLRPGDLV